jgi:hypothetical protein
VTPGERAGPAVAPLETPASDTSRSAHDARPAWRLVTVTLGVAALAAGLLEYVGLGIAARHGGVPEGAAFWRAWSSGALATLGGAIGVGAAAAGVAALAWRRWRRPLRALGAGFALGAATFLIALVLLTAWAP